MRRHLALSAIGRDRPGIVHAATAALAERGIDITDLTTKLAGAGQGDAPPIYALMMEIAPPPGVSEDEIGAALRQVGEAQGVEVAVRALDSETL